MKYMLVAGETSGDLHGARLITAIRKLDPQAGFRFFGGDSMEKAAGHPPVVHCSVLNVMGFSAVLGKFPTIIRQFRRATRLIDEYRPDHLILIDFPGFNLRLAKAAKHRGITVHYFIPPKIWAWKEYRINTIKRYVDHVYSILPFEESYYRKRHDYRVDYVGNPSVQEIDAAMRRLPAKRYFLERMGLDTDPRPIIALLPGSRRSEIRANLRLMIEAARQCPSHRYIVAAAPAIPERFYRQCAEDPGLNLAFSSTLTLLKHADAALVTSGTATLETALTGTPQVVCYRSNGLKLSYRIMERFLKIKYVSLPNLIVNKAIVPELLLHHCTAERIRTALRPLLLGSPERDAQMAGYKTLRAALGTRDAADNAAAIIAGTTPQNATEP